MPPSFDALWHHWQRTCWVSNMWNQAAGNRMRLLDITQYGWKIVGGRLECDWESVENGKAVRYQLGWCIIYHCRQWNSEVSSSVSLREEPESSSLTHTFPYSLFNEWCSSSSSISSELCCCVPVTLGTFLQFLHLQPGLHSSFFLTQLHHCVLHAVTLEYDIIGLYVVWITMVMTMVCKTGEYTHVLKALFMHYFVLYVLHMYRIHMHACVLSWNYCSHTKVHISAYGSGSQSSTTYIVALFLCYRLVYVSWRSETGTESALRLTAPTLHEPREDVSHLTSSTSETRRDFSLLLICRLHALFYTVASTVCAGSGSLLRGEL